MTFDQYTMPTVKELSQGIGRRPSTIRTSFPKRETLGLIEVQWGKTVWMVHPAAYLARMDHARTAGKVTRE